MCLQISRWILSAVALSPARGSPGWRGTRPGGWDQGTGEDSGRSELQN